MIGYDGEMVWIAQPGVRYTVRKKDQLISARWIRNATTDLLRLPLCVSCQVG